MNLRLVFCAFAGAALLVICGAVPFPKLDKNERIIGGHEVEIDEYPYQVSVLHYGLHTCGGVLYKDLKTVLTAAHCVQGKSISTLSVRAGSSIRNFGGEVIKVNEKTEHNDYNNKTMEYDIATLTLQAEFPLASYIQSIMDGVYTAEGGDVYVTGWGSTQEGGVPSTVLRAVDVIVYTKEQCEAFYPNNLIQSSMMCAGDEDGGRDACAGDSGGPLVQIKTDSTTLELSRTLIGLVSWGNGCGRERYPGVYTIVTENVPSS